MRADKPAKNNNDRPRTTRNIFVLTEPGGVIGNGGSNLKLPVNKRRYKSLDALLDELTYRLPHLHRGARRICTAAGKHRVKDLEQLEHNGRYIASEKPPMSVARMQQLKDLNGTFATRSLTNSGNTSSTIAKSHSALPENGTARRRAKNYTENLRRTKSVSPEPVTEKAKRRKVKKKRHEQNRIIARKTKSNREMEPEKPERQKEKTHREKRPAKEQSIDKLFATHSTVSDEAHFDRSDTPNSLHNYRTTAPPALTDDGGQSDSPSAFSEPASPSKAHRRRRKRKERQPVHVSQSLSPLDERKIRHRQRTRVASKKVNADDWTLPPKPPSSKSTRRHSPKKKTRSRSRHKRTHKKTKQEEIEAATKIQSYYRGYRVRRTNRGGVLIENDPPSAGTDRNLTSAQVQRKAITRIQAWVRGFRLRRETKAWGIDTEWRLNQTMKKRQDKAATKIQAQYRGYNVRKHMKQPEAKNPRRKSKVTKSGKKPRKSPRRKSKNTPSKDEHQAATTIQAHYRGYRSRQELKRQNSAASKIQNKYREYSDRKYGRKRSVTPPTADGAKNDGNYLIKKYDGAMKNEAASTIQAAYKGHRVRKDRIYSKKEGIPFRQNVASVSQISSATIQAITKKLLALHLNTTMLLVVRIEESYQCNNNFFENIRIQ